MIKELMINIIFIFIATNIFYYFLNKDKNKRIKMSIILGTLVLIITGLAWFIYKLNIYKYIYIRGLLQFIYEIICWGILINTVYDNKKKLKLMIKFNNTEKCIIIITFIIGVLYLLTIAISNIKYILPINETGIIENMYFNIDIFRVRNELLEFNIPTSSIHPLYRFMNFPIILVISITNMLLNAIGINEIIIMMIDEYMCLIIQLFFNTISSVVLYKILKKSNIKNNLCIIAITLFVFSLAFMWLSIIPETYSITLLTLLLMVYFYNINRKEWILFAILAIGANLINILPASIIILHLFMKSIKSISRKRRYMIYFVFILLILISIPAIIYSYDYIATWSQKTLTIEERITNSINKVIIPVILGPEFISINPYFVQINQVNMVAMVLFIILFINAVIGYVANARKNLIVNICMIQLVIGYILHVIVGYGINNGIIYSPLYCWAFIILAVYGMQYFYNKIKKYTIPIVAFIVILIAIYNILWLFDFRNAISNQNFTEQRRKQNIQVELYYETGEAEIFYIINGSIIQLRTGRTIISNIDGRCVYDKEHNAISGMIKDSRWFKIYTEKDKLMINICENITEIEDSKFFIFGMGLREKFLFKQDNQNYSLIRYSNKQEILKNLILESIDYENYTVHAKNQNNEEVLIYENENGIYVSVEGKTRALDDSIKINIPTFEEYEHKRQLRILFNEVMINITKEGPKPNFIAYEGIFYRDSAIVAMVLNETGNISQIENWIENIDSMYDMQNGYEEADNLGQVLYLMSLVDNKNEELINEIIDEANRLKNEDGYIMGKTDGTYHPVYQTKWLIYGLKSLGMEYQDWNVPNVNDSYEYLIWFDKDDQKELKNISDRWPYILFAVLHYNETKIEFPNLEYPISSEYLSSQANFDKLKIINDDFAKSKLITPHSWSAAEMFLYLLELDRGNL